MTQAGDTQGYIPDHEDEQIRITPVEEQAIARPFAAVSFKTPQNDQTHVIISDLKEQLDKKDAEIAELQKKVKDLKDKNNSLVNALNRIQTLSEMRKKLKEKMKFSVLEIEVNNMQNKIKEMEVYMATKETENAILKKQVRHQSRYVSGAPLLMPVEASEDKTAIVHLGEMCCQIQDMIYKKILPEHFTPIRNYKVKSLLTDIEKLSQSEDEKKQALNRWEDLKTDLKWDEDLEEDLGALQDTYSRSNDTNPPKLSENDLKDSAKCLARLKILWISIKRVNSLIDVWKSLVLCGT